MCLPVYGSRFFAILIRCLWREQRPSNTIKRINRRMRDLFWGMMQPIMVGRCIQPTTTTRVISMWTLWHGMGWATSLSSHTATGATGRDKQKHTTYMWWGRLKVIEVGKRRCKNVRVIKTDGAYGDTPCERQMH